MPMRRILPIVAAVVLSSWSPSAARSAEETVDLGAVSERHEMIPMRDGTRLSAYLYTPPGEGPWPVLYEQRYADTRSRGLANRWHDWRRAGTSSASKTFAARDSPRALGSAIGPWVGAPSRTATTRWNG